MLRSEQIRAARAMLRWEQRVLADAAGVSVPTIKRMEASTGLVRGTNENVTAVRMALQKAGIIFIDGDETAGSGVRMRDPHEE